MTIAFGLLLILIVGSPVFLIADTLLVRGLLAGYCAIATAVVAWSIRPVEAGFLSKLMRPAAALVAIPAIWMLLQALPLPFESLQHPIWSSARTALGDSVIGSISVSRGATLIALTRYLTAFALFFVATAVTIDRQRAELALVWLMIVSALLTALLIFHNAGGFFFLGEITTDGPHAAITAAATLGTVLAAGVFVYDIERYETRHNRPDFSGGWLIASILGASLCFLLCWIGVLLFTSTAALFAAASGLGAFVLIVGFRRLGLSPRAGFILVAAAIALPLSIIAKLLVEENRDLTLRFATHVPAATLEAAQRIIADTGWLGSGAGVFSALLPIYQESATPLVAAVAPTTAAATIIGLGRPALWIVVVLALLAIARLASGALQRGRDSFFPATAAGCAIVLLSEAFFDASLLGSTTIVLGSIAMGLGLAQSVSRTARQTEF